MARRGSGLAALLAAAAMILTGLQRPGVAQPGGPGGSSAPPVHAADFAAGAVACDHPLASEAGAAMLRDGGNAVDAAVAAAFTLSVVRPDSCGIGGGGFMLVHLPARDGEPARTIALDHRETAPAAMGPEYFLNLRDAGRPADVSRVGVHAAGVPGTVAGLLEAHERFGRLPRAKVMAPAIAIAREGWAADEHHASVAGELERRVIAAPHAMPRAAWIRDRLGQSGRIIAGERLRNPEQARALELIAADGAAAFYRGPIAEAIVQAMEAAGGPMTAEDLAGYRPREFEPVRGTYRGRTVLSMPPPSSGGTAILQALGILERLRPQGLEGRGPEDPRRIHALAESLKHAFADRAEWMADPDFVTVPLEQLLAAGTLDAAAARVDPERTFPPTAYGTDMPPPIDGGTSHLSVVDASGMAVALTETINLAFGSLVPVPGFGFVLNNQMDDFTTEPGAANAFGLVQSDRNLPAPGKRPLSSMSPTIVLGPGGTVELVAGASGGPRIITATLQVLLHVLEDDLPLAEAVARPRLHHQWMPDVLEFEPGWDRPADGGGAEGDAAAVDPVAAMEALGHRTGRREAVGVVQAILVRDGRRHAASDPRKGGRPAGH